MSNHTGGYLLNYALQRLAENGLVERLGKRKVQAIVLDIVACATRQYDCNSSEILNELGERLGICYCCEEAVREIKGDVCLKCRKEGGWDDDEEEATDSSLPRVGESDAVRKWVSDATTRIHKQRERQGS